jgi:hypothetical protein
MKLLIITMNVGKTAPGIVFEKLIQGLSSMHKVDLIAADYEPSTDMSLISTIIISKRYNIHPRIYRFLITLFCVNPFDYLWAWKSKIKISRKTAIHYDAVLSFLSFDNYAAVIAGTCLSKKYSIRHAVHSTDAIPAPIGWLEYNRYYRSLKKMMAKYLHDVDAFFTGNSEMLQYQLKTFNPKKNLVTNVIYTPGLTEKREFPKPDTIVNNFIYTGGIYGLRKAEYILVGFEKLLKIFPESKLIFIGCHFSTIPSDGLKPETLEKIYFMPYTKDLEPYYSCATALIDIDANIDDDVFLSSKMANYLMINRLIISETGMNSPSRHLFKGIGSIIQCDHDPDQLCEAMRKSIVSKNNISFGDRNAIIKLFQLENIVDQLTHSLEQVINE